MTNSAYNSGFFTPASRCEDSGGRLLWLDDVMVTDFIHHQLHELLMKTCESCSFLWIGLLQSVNNDKLYFWKRTRQETLKQCNADVSTTKCYDNVNEAECELLGCCYKNQSCFYPGNTTNDSQNEYVDYNTTIHPFHRPYHPPENSPYRHCVGLQRDPFRNMWVLRTVDCKSNLPQTNGFLCQYSCNTVSVQTLESTQIGSDKCNSLQSQCQPISGRNSCFEVVHSNKSSGWFTSAAECESRGGRLLWLNDLNVTQFMKFEADAEMRQVCLNCTYMWIGLMQSVFNDSTFFWKRTQTETLAQCHERKSNVACAFNVTKVQCELLGCCFAVNGCLYPGNVEMDRRNELTNGFNIYANFPGHRRCAGLYRAAREYWIFTLVDDCSRMVTDEQGYFCEFRCGSNWPGPQLSNSSMLDDLSPTTESPSDLSTLTTSAPKKVPYVSLDQTSNSAFAGFTHQEGSDMPTVKPDTHTNQTIAYKKTQVTRDPSTLDSNSPQATAATKPITSFMMTNSTPSFTFDKIQVASTILLTNSTASTTATVSTPSVRVQDSIKSHCTPNGWDVSIDMNSLRKIYPGAKASEIYMGENSCRGTESGNTVRFEQGLRECLTSEIVTQNAIVYRNQLFYAKRDPIHPFIIRNYLWAVGIECDVQRNDTASAHVHHESSYTSVPYISGNSRYGINITFYNESNFIHQISGDPLRIQVGTRVYAKVFTASSDWSIK